jgi:hypothetical protein
MTATFPAKPLAGTDEEAEQKVKDYTKKVAQEFFQGVLLQVAPNLSGAASEKDVEKAVPLMFLDAKPWVKTGISVADKFGPVESHMSGSITLNGVPLVGLNKDMDMTQGVTVGLETPEYSCGVEMLPLKKGEPLPTTYLDPTCIRK